MKRIRALSIVVALLAVAPAELPAQGYIVIRDLVGEDGTSPSSTLVQDSNGFFYGAAAYGGDHGAGTVFKLDANNNFVVLHHFEYTDGSEPQGRLVLGQDGYLYGTADRGGADDAGTLYRLDTDGNNFTVLHDFDVYAYLRHRCLVQDSTGTLYGTNPWVASDAYRVDADGSNYSVIHAFSGSIPYGLTLASDGFLYGVTADSLESVFRLATDGSDFETLHTFTDADEGEGPLGPLIEGSDGFLYGTAVIGGQYSLGTAFKLRKDGSSFQVIHDFQTSDGTFPQVALTQVAGGLLYGVANAGGAGGGTVFRMTTSGGLFDSVHDFEAISGDDPRGAVLQGLDGSLYGTTESGGTGGVFGGVVYRLSIPTIASLSPSSGPAGGGTLVTISGSGFQSGASVTIGGSLAGAVIGPGEITASSPPLSAGSLNDVLVTNPDATLALDEKAWLADFQDVPQSDPFHDFVETIVRHGITAGCGGGNYCGVSFVTRAQMAVFLLKTEHGSAYVPPQCAGLFGDVACPSQFADWIEQLAAENITAGCGGGKYCPTDPNTRGQMAVFLQKTFSLQ
ncbi:MAG: choice-of-anchor tandem repeat GloVer-containing protein [Acidobacteriota bacterium]